MVGPLLALERTLSKDMESAVAKLDNMLVNWKLHLPREKQDVVDKNEEVDELLFQACHQYVRRVSANLFHMYDILRLWSMIGTSWWTQMAGPYSSTTLPSSSLRHRDYFPMFTTTYPASSHWRWGSYLLASYQEGAWCSGSCDWPICSALSDQTPFTSLYLWGCQNDTC